jgi:hypothetical protein
VELVPREGSSVTLGTSSASAVMSPAPGQLIARKGGDGDGNAREAFGAAACRYQNFAIGGGGRRGGLLLRQRGRAETGACRRRQQGGAEQRFAGKRIAAKRITGGKRGPAMVSPCAALYDLRRGAL